MRGMKKKRLSHIEDETFTDTLNPNPDEEVAVGIEASTHIQDTIKSQLELEVTKNQCKRAKAIVEKTV
ncbi:hypothetical protein Tco_0485094 [Tanacetum coccineum]